MSVQRPFAGTEGSRSDRKEYHFMQSIPPEFIKKLSTKIFAIHKDGAMSNEYAKQSD